MQVHGGVGEEGGGSRQYALRHPWRVNGTTLEEVSQFVVGAERGLKMSEWSNQPHCPGSKTHISFFSSFVTTEKTDREFIPAAGLA